MALPVDRWPDDMRLSDIEAAVHLRRLWPGSAPRFGRTVPADGIIFKESRSRKSAQDGKWNSARQERVVQIIEEFSDDRLKNWCIHCGGWLAGQPPWFRAARAAATIVSLSVEGGDVW
ncbi:hypothetical protein ACVW0I_001787 [Bradyrhizobium sp. LM6.11]